MGQLEVDTSKPALLLSRDVVRLVAADLQRLLLKVRTIVPTTSQVLLGDPSEKLGELTLNLRNLAARAVKPTRQSRTIAD